MSLSLAELRDRKARGLQYVQVTVNRQRSPRNWDHVRVVPGLYGRIVGRLDRLSTTYLVDVFIDDWIALLERIDPDATPKGGT